MTKSFTLNNSRSVIGFIPGLKSRVTPFHSRFTLVALSLCTLLLLGGFTTRAWAGRTHTGQTAVVAGQGKATVKIHYRKVAWNSDDAYTGAENSTTGSSLVEASYERGGTQDGSIAFYAEETVTGYTFSGWYESADCSGTPISTENPYWAVKRATSSGVTKVAYAKFTPTDVTFNANGGSVATSTKTVTDGGTYGTLPVPTRSNYTFLNWYTGASDGAVVTASTTVTNKVNHTLYAHWTPNYTITLNNQSATTAGTESIIVALNLNNNLTSAITTPTKSGCVFDGYYTGANGTGAQIIDAFGNILASKSDVSYTYTDASKNWKYAGNITLYANWISKYTPDFDFVGSTAMKVGETQTDVFTFTHVPVPVASISVVSIDALQDANYSGKVIEYSDNKIYARNAGRAKLVIDQAVNDTILAGHSDTVTITVAKHVTSFSGSTYDELLVDGTQLADYSYTNVSAAKPTANSSDAFYYAIEDISYTNSAKNKKYNSLDSLVRFNPNDKLITALNAGTGKITFYQAETYKYTGDTVSFDVEVSKHENTLYAKGSDSYAPTMYVDASIASVALTATNTDYTNCPISVTQTAGRAIATYEQDDETVLSYHHLGTATWRMTQPENYKYEAGDNTFSVTVAKEDEGVCYVLPNDDSYQEWLTTGTTKTYSFSEKGSRLYFDAKRITWGGFSNNTNFFAEYSTDGSSWTKYESPSIVLENADTWYYSLYYDLPENARYVRFESTVGATGKRAIQNVKVTRKTWMQASTDTLRISKTSASNPVYPNDVVGVGSFDIRYSVMNGGNLKIYNDNPSKFTLSQTIIEDVNCSADTVGINVAYTPNAAGNDTAHLIIYNTVYRDTVVLIGTCVKHHQSGSWKENIEKLPRTMKVAHPYTSTMSGTHGVSYSIIGKSATAVSFNGDTIIASTSGTSTVRAYVEGDDLYYAIADTIDIEVTNDFVQYIIWSQDNDLAHFEVGDANYKMNAYADSDIDTCHTNGRYAEHKRGIIYTIEGGGTSVVQVVDSCYLQINGVGTAYVRATQAGGTDHDGHSYASTYMIKKVVVRGPDTPCRENYLYNFNDESTTGNDNMGGETGVHYQRGSATFTSGTFNSRPAYITLFTKNRDNGKGTGTVSVQQNVPGTGWVAVGTITNPSNTSWNSIPDTMQLRSDATQVRIVIDQTKDYIYCGGVKVHRAEFAVVAEDEVEKDTLVFSSNIRTPQSKDVELRRYAKNALFLSLQENAPFTLSTEDVSKNCSPDTTSLRITFNSNVEMSDSCFNLAIMENGSTLKTIVLKATNRPDTCTFTTNGNWETDDEHWTKYPNENLTAVIDEDVEVTITGNVHAYALTIKEGAKVTIAPNGGLTVGAGGIKGATASNLKIQASSDGKNGFLRVSPRYTGTMPTATIEMYSKAYYQTSPEKVVTWQYIGAPVKEVSAKATFNYLYNWDESTGGWVNRRSSTTLEPFKGYATTQKKNADGVTITFNGELVEPTTQTVELTCSPSSPKPGCNVIANSFAAPIDISRLTPDDFPAGAEATINFFNTGSKYDIAARELTKAVDLEAAGQYIPVPVRTARVLHAVDGYPILIPSMQGFYVNTSAAGNMTLDYDRLVWNADYDKSPIQPLRVAGRTRNAATDDEEELTGTMKITLATQTAIDHLILLESEDYAAYYENGYDARKMMSDELNIFAVEGDDQLAIDATNSIIGTRVGVRTGEETAYTLLFSRVSVEEELALYDNETGQTININNGTQYTFFAEPDAMITNRFTIVERKAPSITTGIDNAENNAKVHKFIKDNQIFILKNGILYNAMGAIVR